MSQLAKSTPPSDIYGWQSRTQVEGEPLLAEEVRLDSSRGKNRGNFSLLYFLFVGLVVFIAWAYWFELDQAVRSQGNVIPSSRTQIVQVADGGVLENLLVKEGQQVDKGQVLAVLEQSRANATFSEVKAELIGLQVKQIRFAAEAEGEVPDFSEIDHTYDHLVREQMKLFHINRKTHEDTLADLDAKLALANEELVMNNVLYDSGDISRLDMMRSKRQVQDIKGEQTDVRNRYYQDARSEASDLAVQVIRAKHSLAEQQSRLDHLKVLAPTDGVVKFLKMHTLGGVLRGGDELMQISPTDSEIIVEVRLRPMDVGSLSIGLPATVKLDAFDYAIYGSLQGTLTYISPDTLTEQVNGREETYYRAQVSLLTQSQQENEKLLLMDLKQGMTASVDVKTGKRSVLEYIAKPIVRAFSGALIEK